MLVSVGPTGRVEQVHLPRLGDDLRDPSTLSDAVRAAHHAALVGPRNETLPRPLPRPVSLAARPPIKATNPWVEGRTIGPVDSEWAHRVLAARPGVVDGTSGNGCVTVTLAPGSTAGSVAADPGWLRQAEAQHVATALTEAFADAYRKRDGR